MKFQFCVLIIVFLFCNCRDVQNEVKVLYSKPIIIPTEKIDYYTNKAGNRISNSRVPLMKFVVYIDSLECASCSMKKINEWDFIVDSIVQISNRINVYFILTPRKVNLYSVRKVLISEGVRYPILIDTLGEFERLNPHLPKNQALHTFLLDENNRVILVGNPLRNEKIKEMFYKIVEEKLGKPGEVAVKEN